MDQNTGRQMEADHRTIQREMASKGWGAALAAVAASAVLVGSGCAAKSGQVGAGGDGAMRTSGGAGSGAEPAWVAGVLSRRWDGEARGLAVFSGGDGRRVAWEEVVAAAAGADVVIVGELHGHRAGQAFQEALWADVLAQAPGAGGVGGAVASLEFFERDQQLALDDYLAGVTDRGAFLRAARRTPGNYPFGHREIVESSKAAGKPVIAANAPRRYVRMARLEGFERLAGLSEEQRRTFVIPRRMPEGRYREEFMSLMTRGRGHREAPDAAATARAEAMFRSQSVWDWTMADSIARGLSDGYRPVVHIVGRFHSDFGGGLVEALEGMRPDVRIVTISCMSEWSQALKDDDRGRGDFVLYMGPGEGE